MTNQRTAIFIVLTASLLCGQPATRGMLPGVQPFVVINSPVLALTHVRVIDGTGGAVQ